MIQKKSLFATMSAAIHQNPDAHHNASALLAVLLLVACATPVSIMAEVTELTTTPVEAPKTSDNVFTRFLKRVNDVSESIRNAIHDRTKITVRAGYDWTKNGNNITNADIVKPAAKAAQPAAVFYEEASDENAAQPAEDTAQARVIHHFKDKINAVHRKNIHALKTEQLTKLSFENLKLIWPKLSDEQMTSALKELLTKSSLIGTDRFKLTMLLKDKMITRSQAQMLAKTLLFSRPELLPYNDPIYISIRTAAKSPIQNLQEKATEKLGPLKQKVSDTVQRLKEAANKITARLRPKDTTGVYQPYDPATQV